MFRVYCIILSIIFYSCNRFFSEKEKEAVNTFDTVIDFTKVDTSPSFKKCLELIEQEKTDCFRSELQLKTLKGLQQFSDNDSVLDSIDEKVILSLIITDKGDVKIKAIDMPSNVKENMPNLESHIKHSIENLPKLSPATKRGIPVTTQYQMPIHIKTE